MQNIRYLLAASLSFLMLISPASAQFDMKKVNMKTLEETYKCYDPATMKRNSCQGLFREIKERVSYETLAGVGRNTGLDGNNSPDCTYVALANLAPHFEKLHFDYRYSKFDGKIPTLAHYIDHVRTELAKGLWQGDEAEWHVSLVTYYEQVKGGCKSLD